jgi:hypothetical protein
MPAAATESRLFQLQPLPSPPTHCLPVGTIVTGPVAASATPVATTHAAAVASRNLVSRALLLNVEVVGHVAWHHHWLKFKQTIIFTF